MCLRTEFSYQTVKNPSELIITIIIIIYKNFSFEYFLVKMLPGVLSHRVILLTRCYFTKTYCYNLLLFYRDMLLVVLEIMSGGELFDMISRKKRFTEREACIVTKQVTLLYIWFFIQLRVFFRHNKMMCANIWCMYDVWYDCTLYLSSN